MQLVYPGSDPIDWRQVCDDYASDFYSGCWQEYDDLGQPPDYREWLMRTQPEVLHLFMWAEPTYTDDIHTVTTEELEERERVALYRSYIESLYLSGSSSDEMPTYDSRDWPPFPG